MCLKSSAKFISDLFLHTCSKGLYGRNFCSATLKYRYSLITICARSEFWVQDSKLTFAVWRCTFERTHLIFHSWMAFFAAIPCSQASTAQVLNVFFTVLTLQSWKIWWQQKKKANSHTMLCMVHKNNLYYTFKFLKMDNYGFNNKIIIN